MTNVDTYRPKIQLIYAAVGTLITFMFIWSSFYEGGATSETVSALVALFVLIFIYIFLIRPKIIFSDEGIVIVNPIEDVTIGWADVIELDAKWAMAIATEKFTVSSWVATAPGRHRNRGIHYTEIKGLNIESGGSIRTADSPRSDSGAAAYRARVRLKRFQDKGDIASLTTSRKRQVKPLALAGLALVAAIATNFFGH